nr:citrate/2-methylcitrate synthase [Wolbachia endosymbiont of Frankliniella intonsa]
MSAGVATLWGPAHGGSFNEAVINMLKEIEQSGDVDIDLSLRKLKMIKIHLS